MKESDWLDVGTCLDFMSGWPGYENIYVNAVPFSGTESYEHMWKPSEFLRIRLPSNGSRLQT